MSLKSKCYNYKILRIVLEDIDLIHLLHRKENQSKLASKAFHVEFLFPISGSINHNNSNPRGQFGNIISEIFFRVFKKLWKRKCVWIIEHNDKSCAPLEHSSKVNSFVIYPVGFDNRKLPPTPKWEN